MKASKTNGKIRNKDLNDHSRRKTELVGKEAHG